MKKLLVLLLWAALLCGAAFAENSENIENVEIPNPIVEIQDDDQFEDRLHIEFDADDLNARDISMSIIAGQTGQASFTLQNVDGDAVEWTLRFTRDAYIAQDTQAFSGIYDADMRTPTQRQIEFSGDDADDPSIQLEITQTRANTEGYDILTWNYGGVYYCLSIHGVYSQMQFAEIFDQLLEATIDD